MVSLSNSIVTFLCRRLAAALLALVEPRRAAVRRQPSHHAQTVLGIHPAATLTQLQANHPVHGEVREMHNTIQWVDQDYLFGGSFRVMPLPSPQRSRRSMHLAECCRRSSDCRRATEDVARFG